MKLWMYWASLAACIASVAVAEDFAPVTEIDRDPAALVVPLKKRSYPGGGDEEDLRVQASLPEAALKTDSRTLQRDVYKQLYNQELKEDRHDEVEE
ncbi:MAG: hypothetical protein KF799_07255 [Bdellovibrionales bacterium]|nr:hypothetical protein [Bdellovibrionales bacterium]